MPIDTSIYGSLIQPPKSLIGYTNELDQADAAHSQAQAAKLNLIGQQQSYQDDQKLRQLYAQPGFDPSKPESLPGIFAISPKAGMAAQKSMLDAQQTQADIAHKNAQAAQAAQATAASQFEIGRKKLETAMQIVTTAQTPADAHASFQQAVQQGLMTPQEAAQKEQEIPTDTQGFQNWRQQSALSLLSVKDRLDQAMKAQTQAETARHNQVDEGLKQQGITAENNRSAATLKKDYTVAGLNPDGSPMADVASTVKAIGEYRMAPPTLQALRNPRMAGIMDQVNREYPGFDATQYGMRQKAMKDFGTGPQGQQIQAANTALNHLDTLTKLAEAQKNGNTQLFNQVANEWAKQTGNPVPSNLQGAITLVGPEISKAVVGAGGGQGDREKVDAALSAITKGSPAQQAGQIATMKDIFGGRLSEVGRTYKRSTGLDNFNDMLSPAAQQMLHARGGDTSEHPADVQAILDKYGVK